MGFLNVAIDEFAQVFGGRPDAMSVAPGRINLIGEHTDYNQGYVLPMAIDRYTIACARVIDEAEPWKIECHSQAQGELISLTRENLGHCLGGWGEFLRGAVVVLQEAGLQLPSMQILLESNVPVGAGLSSSAALELSLLGAIQSLANGQMDEMTLARLGQQIEHRFVGVPCGFMDQCIAANGRAGMAVLLDCADDSMRYVDFEQNENALLVMNSGVRHALADGEYGERRTQCQEALSILSAGSFRDVDCERLNGARGRLGDVLNRRARHVLTENDRVMQFVNAISNKEWLTAGEVMYASHQSLMHDYEVSCPELDKLVALAKSIGIAGGVWGSRMTGGGFGGCTISMVDRSRADEIAKRIAARYIDCFDVQPDSFVVRAASGLRVFAV
ncbi:MAG: galactokinase [Pirellulaceae bacterium]